jgi:hypothetical protein
MAVRVGFEHGAYLKTRKLLIPINGKNAQIAPSADSRYTAGTRDTNFLEASNVPRVRASGKENIARTVPELSTPLENFQSPG